MTNEKWTDQIKNRKEKKSNFRKEDRFDCYSYRMKELLSETISIHCHLARINWPSRQSKAMTFQKNLH